jgi:hypothetical protein
VYLCVLIWHFFSLQFFFFFFFPKLLVGTTFTFFTSVEASYYHYYRVWAFIQWPWVSFLSMGSGDFFLEWILWYQKFCQIPPSPHPPPFSKKKKSANLSQFCTRKNPEKFWKKVSNFFSHKKLQNFLETKSQDVIYLLSKKVGVLWVVLFATLRSPKPWSQS